MLDNIEILQLHAFQSLFSRRMENEHMTPEMAFASSIADTSDDVFERALSKRPDLVNKWLSEFESKKINRKKVNNEL